MIPFILSRPSAGGLNIEQSASTTTHDEKKNGWPIDT
jgi:hypothetical protein